MSSGSSTRLQAFAIQSDRIEIAASPAPRKIALMRNSSRTKTFPPNMIRVKLGSARTVGGAFMSLRSSGANHARGPTTGTREKDLTLAMARLVREKLALQGATVQVELTRESYTPVVDFDGPLRDRLARVIGRGEPGAVPVLPTGAGHDAGILASVIPTAMLFVRNPTGVSHSPAEHAEEDDCLAGVAALADVLEDLACQG